MGILLIDFHRAIGWRGQMTEQEMCPTSTTAFKPQ